MPLWRDRAETGCFDTKSFRYQLKQWKCTKISFTSSIVCAWTTNIFWANETTGNRSNRGFRSVHVGCLKSIAWCQINSWVKLTVYWPKPFGNGIKRNQSLWPSHRQDSPGRYIIILGVWYDVSRTKIWRKLWPLSHLKTFLLTSELAIEWLRNGLTRGSNGYCEKLAGLTVNFLVSRGRMTEGSFWGWTTERLVKQNSVIINSQWLFGNQNVLRVL